MGTPFFDISSYTLLGFYLGIETSEYEMHRYRVEYNGYEFLLMTFKNEMLRMLQLYSLSSELEQAIGRSRLLRTNATVYLFSSFPCEQAEIHQEDYLEEKYVSVPDKGTPTE